MPSLPRARDVHYDKFLSNLSIEYKNEMFVADIICPYVDADHQSDRFVTWGQEDFTVLDDYRGDGDVANEVYDTISSASFFCEERALRKIVTDRQKKNADDVISPEISATKRLTRRIMLNREDRVATLLTTAANITNNSTPAVKWDASSPTIQANINTAMGSVEDNCGLSANTIVLPRAVARAISADSTIVDLIKYTHPDLLVKERGIVIPEMLWGMKVALAGTQRNTANLAQTVSLTAIWSDNVVIAHVDPEPGKEVMSGCYTFRWGTRTVKKWRDEPRGGIMIEVSEFTDEVITANGAIYLLTDTMT